MYGEKIQTNKKTLNASKKKIFLNKYLYTKLDLKKNLMSHESTGKYKKDKANKK